MTEEATQANSAEPAAVEDAQGDIEELRRQSEDHWNKYLRAVADLENLRKRNAREVENAHRFGVERLVATLLPVRDSMEAAIVSAEKADAEALLEGQRATLRLLDEALKSAGIEEIDPEGEPFDPNQHEAMSMLPSAEVEPNSVLQVVQKGYRLHERIVRPARVIVARDPEEGAG